MKNFIFVLLSFSMTGTACSPSTEELYYKADKLIEQKQYKKAIDTYDRILKKKPDFQDAVYNKAYCYLQDSSYALALYFFQAALKMKGDSDNSSLIMEWNEESPFAPEEARHQIPLGELYFQIGVTKYYMDSLSSSYEYFKKCISRDYERAKAYTWQGVIWVSIDSIQKGCDCFDLAKKFGGEEAVEYIKNYCGR